MSNYSKPTISIITVVFNGAKTLRATIESITPQLTDDIEYLIIDGGSNDGTQDIIQSYAHHLAYWTSESDNGIYDAWNKALTKASGRYIGFVGADDVLLPNTLAVYLNSIHKQPEVEYWSSRIAFGKINGRIIGQPWRWKRFRRYMCVAHVGSLHSRSLYERFGLYDTSYRIAGDYDFLLRSGSTLKAGFIDIVSAVMGDGGVSNKAISLALEETARAKIRHKATSVAVARIDQLLAQLKVAIRSRLTRKP